MPRQNHAAPQLFPEPPVIPGNPMSGYYQPAGQPQYGAGLPGDFSDPYNLYLSAVPLMQQNMDRSVGSAVASLAPGNRYSSAAFGAAGKAGMEGALNMNQMLSGLMYNQYNTDADRALQAAGMQLSASPMVEQAMGSRFGVMGDALQKRLAAWESGQSRKMAAARMGYQNWKDNRYGTLPMLIGAASNAIGQGPEPILSTKPGSQGYGDDIANLFAAWLSGRG